MSRQYGAGARASAAPSQTAATPRLSREQILRLLQDKGLRLADNPSHVALVHMAAMLPQDASLQDLLGLVLERHQTQATLGTAVDPLYVNYPSVGSVPPQPGDIVCGYMPTGDSVFLGPGAFFCNLGVFGRTGASKTSWLSFILPQLIERGFLIVVFQQKDEYGDWALDPTLRGKILPLRLSDFRLSFVERLAGVPLRYQLYTTFADFGISFGRVYAHRFGQDIGDKCLKQLPLIRGLPLNLLIEQLVRFKSGRGSVEAHYRESMLSSAQHLEDVFGDVFNYESSDFLEKLYEREGLISITVDAPAGPSTFAVIGIIRHLYSQRKYSNDDPSTFTPVVYVIEDGTILTDEKELGGATSPLVTMSFLARKFKIGFIYVGHSITGTVSRKLLANLQSVFLFGISNEDPRTIQTLLGCTPAVAQLVQALEQGRFLCLAPSFHPACVSGRFPHMSPPRKLSERERQVLVRPFLDSVRTVKYTGRSLPGPAVPGSSTQNGRSVPAPTPDELKVLLAVAAAGPVTITQLYERCGFNRRHGGKVLKELNKKGLVRVPMSGRTGFPRLTETGWDVAEAKGLARPRKKTNGEDDHELGAELIEADQRRQSRTVTFEVSVDGKRFDAAALDRRTGRKTFFEIGVSDPHREATGITTILGLPVMQDNTFIFVARDKQFARGVVKALQERCVPKDVIKSIVIKTFADFATVS